MVSPPLLHHLLGSENRGGGCQVRGANDSQSGNQEALGSLCPSVCSSKVEMGKWIEDLNMAIDLAKKSQEKSSLFLDAGDRSNRKSPVDADEWTWCCCM